MKRFYYSAIREGKECDGIVRAESIDSAKKKLFEEGCEEITLSVLSSPPVDFDQNGLAENNNLPPP